MQPSLHASAPGAGSRRFRKGCVNSSKTARIALTTHSETYHSLRRMFFPMSEDYTISVAQMKGVRSSLIRDYFRTRARQRLAVSQVGKGDAR